MNHRKHGVGRSKVVSPCSVVKQTVYTTTKESCEPRVVNLVKKIRTHFEKLTCVHWKNIKTVTAEHI